MQKSESAKFNILNGLDDFSGLEVVDAKYKNQNFSKHVHEGYTIGVIETGAQRFFRSGENHTAGEGSIILVNADDVHNGRSATEGGWSYQALYPTPKDFQRICSDTFQSDDGIPYFKDSVIQDREMASHLRSFFSAVKVQSDPLLLESLLYATLTRLVSTYSTTSKEQVQPPTNKAQLFLVRDFIEDMYHLPLSLKDLSTIGGVSPFHLSREFKKLFGLPPHKFLIQVRLKKAKEMLKAGIPAAGVAISCGFHDQSHFLNCFKKTVGTTPSSFQKFSKILQ